MNIEIKAITKAQELNIFLINCKHAAFLQSWEWGEFCRSVGNNISRFGFYRSGKLVGVCTLIKKKLPFGKHYFYAPRGPVFLLSNSEINIQDFFKLFCEKNILFLRIEPNIELEKIFNQVKFQKTLPIQPQKTLLLDLKKGESELLKAMHQKTRYNINLSLKKGVVIKEGNLNDWKVFWTVMAETSKRDGFKLHSENYYIAMLESLMGGALDEQKLSFKFLMAEHECKILAGGIFAFFGDTVTYVHGASSNEYRQLMAPYALQWTAIQLAIKNNYHYYDFYGVDEIKWPGVTRFKKGFSGKELHYPGAFDIVCGSLPAYRAYQISRYLRRLI